MKSQKTTDLSLLKGLSVLYVEDDDALRSQMVEFLHMLFGRVCPAENGLEGLEAFHKYSPDIILTDIKMPVMDGLEMAAQVKQKSPDTPIIITTAFSEVDYLIRAIEIGIDRYVQKPIDEDLFLDALYKSGLPLLQGDRIKRLENTLHASLAKKLGTSKKMEEVIKQIRQIAITDFSVVLQGETGVGKSLVAGIIHELSNRANKPFVPVDVGSIPETLVESELFGYKKGAFTGAAKDKKGLLETANTGTVFLDELENMTPHVQAKLLRTVEEKKIYPVGGTEAVDIDVRIIAATNIDFKKIVEEKKFREDLFYRLYEFDITLPPLRERPEDIPMLARHFFCEAAGELNKKIKEIADDAVKLLAEYEWPGNIRELKNVMRRAVLVCETAGITADDILNVLKPLPKDENSRKEADTFFTSPIPSLALEDLEKWAIRQALHRTGDKRMKAAALLRIDYKRLMRKMEKYGIEIKG